jgi:hypothetical protein
MSRIRRKVDITDGMDRMMGWNVVNLTHYPLR